MGHGPAAGLELLVHCQPMRLSGGVLGCLRPETRQKLGKEEVQDGDSGAAYVRSLVSALRVTRTTFHLLQFTSTPSSSFFLNPHLLFFTFLGSARSSVVVLSRAIFVSRRLTSYLVLPPPLSDSSDLPAPDSM